MVKTENSKQKKQTSISFLILLVCLVLSIYIFVARILVEFINLIALPHTNFVNFLSVLVILAVIGIALLFMQFLKTPMSITISQEGIGLKYILGWKVVRWSDIEFIELFITEKGNILSRTARVPLTSEYKMRKNKRNYIRIHTKKYKINLPYVSGDLLDGLIDFYEKHHNLKSLKSSPEQTSNTKYGE
ncbi:MAG: hypothetical protein WC974_05975 [Thermoplasmata archaeon]